MLESKTNHSLDFLHMVNNIRVSLKDDGPTGQTTGQRGSDPSAYRGSKR